MPTLQWIGKDKVINHHIDAPFRVLDHVYGFKKNAKTTREIFSGNRIIHGDNLEALKSLLPEFEGKVNCIYIDPPYNTGEEKWKYNDNVNHPKIKKWMGEIVGNDENDFSRHDKWLCMMYPRLRLLQKLLSTNGVIFISIDDNEFPRLKLICDEIFGTKNFVSTLVWEKKKKGTHLSKKRISIKEYIIVYAKDKTHFNGLIGEINAESETYPCINPGNTRSVRIIPAGTKSTYREKNFCKKAGETISSGTMHLTLIDDLIIENGRLKFDVKIDAEWRYTQDNLDLFAKSDVLYFTRDLYLRQEVNKARYKKLKDLLLRVEYETINSLKDDLIKALSQDQKDIDLIEDLKSKISLYEGNHHLVTDNLKDLNNTGWGSNEDGDEEIRKIFGLKVFDYPKPTRLIIKLFASTMFSDGIFLDSFAGTGTSAHAVLALNSIDGGNRKFILIEMEDYAESITAERVKRVITEHNFPESEIENPKDSFDFYSLGERLFKDDGNLNESVGTEIIRKYIWYAETNSADINHENLDNEYFLGKQNETAYYFYYEPDTLTALNREFLATIKSKAEQYIVYADKCLLSKDFMLKKNIIFKKIPRDIRKF